MNTSTRHSVAGFVIWRTVHFTMYSFEIDTLIIHKYSNSMNGESTIETQDNIMSSGLLVSTLPP